LSIERSRIDFAIGSEPNGFVATPESVRQVLASKSHLASLYVLPQEENTVGKVLNFFFGIGPG
jgi:hypothetical protein